MTGPDGKIKQLTLELREVRAEQEVRLARVLVVIASVALFLVVSMGWYTDMEVGEDTVANASGWEIFSVLAGSSEGVLVFGGYYSWVVVLAALGGAAAVLRLTQRWVCATLSTMLTLLALGHLLIAGQVKEDFYGEQLAAGWAGLAVMVFAAIVWGHLFRQLREHSPV